LAKKFHIGERIKKRRTELGLSQSEIVGNYITRNMLSRIENGFALPSVETLEYLAEQLDVPEGYFFAEEKELLQYKKMQILPELRELYREGKYKECAMHCRKLLEQGADDELSVISLGSLMRMAEEAVFSLEIMECEQALEAAAAVIGDTPYISEGFLDKLSEYTLFLSRFSQRSAQELPMCSGKTAYIKCLELTDEKKSAEKYIQVLEKGSIERIHIEAREALISGNADGAAVIMEAAAKNEDGTPAVRYLMFSDLENIFTERGDFEQAYRCAQMKMKLLSRR